MRSRWKQIRSSWNRTLMHKDRVAYSFIQEIKWLTPSSRLSWCPMEHNAEEMVENFKKCTLTPSELWENMCHSYCRMKSAATNKK